MGRVIRFSFLLSLAWIFASVNASAQSALKTPRAPSPNNPGFISATTPKPQAQFAPYYTAELGWHTELQLKNNLTAGTLAVTPVMRVADGGETPLASITLQPGEVQSLN